MIEEVLKKAVPVQCKWSRKGRAIIGIGSVREAADSVEEAAAGKPYLCRLALITQGLIQPGCTSAHGCCLLYSSSSSF